MRIPQVPGSKYSQGAVGKRNVEAVAAYSILEEEAGRRI